ncbi:MAG: hypothetical protein R6V44_12250 [Paracoccaceae bacterium]
MPYKYEILGPGGEPQPATADPLGFGAASRPDDVSVVRRLDRHDDARMTARAARNRSDAPISICERHLPSWRRTPEGRWPTRTELAETPAPSVAEMSFTHIETLPI